MCQSAPNNVISSSNCQKDMRGTHKYIVGSVSHSSEKEEQTAKHDDGFWYDYSQVEQFAQRKHSATDYL